MKLVEGKNGQNFWICEIVVNSSALAICVGEEEFGAKVLLANFTHQTPSIWSELYLTMETGFADYEHSEEFPPAEFVLNVGWMTPDVYMGDKSSVHLRFEFEIEKFSGNLPFYDFFLDDSFKIVHHQPVF